MSLRPARDEGGALSPGVGSLVMSELPPPSEELPRVTRSVAPRTSLSSAGLAPTASLAPGQPGAALPLLTRWLFPLACGVVVLWGLEAAASLLLPLTFAALLAMLSAPLVFWLQDHRVPPALGIPLVLLGVVVALAGLVALIGSSLGGAADRVAAYQEKLAAILADIGTWLEAHGVEVSRDKLTGFVVPAQAAGFIGQAIAGVMGLLSNALLVVLTLAFLLFELIGVPGKLTRAFGGSLSLVQVTRAVRDVKRYVVIKTYLSLATAILVGLFLWVTDVDFPVLWALIAFVLNFVPSIGAIIAGIPPFILALVDQGVGAALVVLIGYGALNFVIGSLVEPALLGRRLGLSAFYVFFSLILWGGLWGPVGMLLAVPLTMLLKLVFESQRDLRWASTMMDSGPPRTVRSSRRPAAPSAPGPA